MFELNLFTMSRILGDEVVDEGESVLGDSLPVITGLDTLRPFACRFVNGGPCFKAAEVVLTAIPRGSGIADRLA